MEFQQAARDTNKTHTVPEIMKNLATDQRHGKGTEGVAGVWIKAVHGLDQPQAANLDQIVKIQAVTPNHTTSHLPHQAAVHFNNAIAQIKCIIILMTISD